MNPTKSDAEFLNGGQWKDRQPPPKAPTPRGGRRLSARERFGVFVLVVVSAFSFALRSYATGPTVPVGAVKLYSSNTAPCKSGDACIWQNTDQLNFRTSGGSDIALSGSTSFNVKGYGADSTGIANSSTAVTNAIAAMPSTGAQLYFPPGSYLLSSSISITKPLTVVIEAGATITVHSTTISIASDNVSFVGYGWSSKIVQDTAGFYVMTSTTGKNNITLRDIQFVGVSGTGFSSGNSLLKVTAGGDGLTVQRCKFLNFQHYAIWTHAMTRVNVSDNQFVGNVAYLAEGGSNTVFSRNIVRDPQTPNTTFVVPLQFDSTASGGGVNTDITITDNEFLNWNASQNILLHSGNGFVIANNVINNGYYGIALGVFQAGDTLQDGTITGNTISNSTSSGLAGIANVGIDISGIVGQPVQRISVVGNRILNSNSYSLNDAWGCILLAGNMNDVLVSSNILDTCYGNAISSVGANANRLSILANHIDNVQDSTGLVKVGIGVWTNTTQSGWISDNFINSVRQGIRFDIATSFVYGANTMTNVSSTRVVNPSNAAAVQLDGMNNVGNASFEVDAVAANQTVASTTTNTTAAALGAQQFSPMNVTCGQGWDSTNSLSKQVCCGWQTATVQGAGNPTGQVRYYCSINGGAYAEIARVSSAGALQVPAGQGVDSNAAGAFNMCQANCTSSVWGNSANTSLQLTTSSTNGTILFNGGLQCRANAIAQSTSSMTLNASVGCFPVVTLTASVTSVTLSNFPLGQRYCATFVQGGAGSFTITGWPANVKWLPSTYRGTTHTAPTLTTTVGARDTLCWVHDGTNLVQVAENLNN